MKPKPEFKAEEVWAVARAVLGNSINYDVTHGMNAYNDCAHCRGHVYHHQDAEKIEHDPGCVVLIARDLLTGAPVEKSKAA